MFQDSLLEVIERHYLATPLFLYYAAHIIHKPYQVRIPEEYLISPTMTCVEYITQWWKYLDDVVGVKLSVHLLKKKNLWDNLLFVTSSDNGGACALNSSS